MALELPLAVPQSAIVFISLATFVIFLVKSRLISKLLDTICASNSFKSWFADLMKTHSSSVKNHPGIFDVHVDHYKKMGDKILEIGGDVLEIGAGTGRYLDLLSLPEESSLVVLDLNPFMEKHFRESLAKLAPHIKLKDYRIQSAADMSNIPDNTFAVVYTEDMMCSMEIEVLQKMLKEIKRVLKPDGCLFFMEHVLDVPGTWRRTLQKFITSQLGIWPRLLDNCHCDRETLRYIQEAGFSSVNLSYVYLPTDNVQTSLSSKALLYFIRLFVIGHAKK